MTNRSSVAPADHERQQKGGSSTEQVGLCVQFPVDAGSSHTKDFEKTLKMGVVPACMVLRLM